MKTIIYAIFFTLCLPLALNASIAFDVTPSCPNLNDGSIDLSIQGTGAPYDYIWSNGDTTQDISNLAPGNYSVTITYLGGTGTNDCAFEYNIEVPQAICCVVDSLFAIQIEEVSCVCPNGEGNIDITVLGESGPYTYAWTSDNGFYSEEEDILVEFDGIYRVTVTNSYGCTNSQDIPVSFCDFNINNFTTNIKSSCEGENSGSINVQTDGVGTSPYTFLYEDVHGNIIFTDSSSTGYSEVMNLAAGKYFLTVLSANGCQTSSDTLQIEGPFEAPDVTYIITPATNDYTDDGAIDLTVSGNPNDYSYQWSSPDFSGFSETTQDLNNLAEGNYTVEIFYEGGLCSITLDIKVWICEDLSDDMEVFSIITPLSPGEDDGAIDITLEGVDYYEFNYLWVSNQQGFPKTTQDITGLSAGTYCLKISHPTCTDLFYQQCFDICDFGLEIRSTGFDDCNGTTLFVITTEQVSYQWSTGEDTPTIFANYNQEYCITVTDNAGCQAVRCTTIIPPPLELSFDITNATLGNSNGSVTANVSGGFPPYSYTWLGGTTDHKIVWLDPGMYPIVVTDDCGNTISGTAIVECEIGQNQVHADITPVTCGNFATGSIDLTVNPSSGNVFTWSNGASTEDIDGLVAGIYSVTIVNTPTGCEFTKEYTVGTNGQGNFNIAFLTQPICNGVNGGFIAAIVSGGTNPYTYEWRQWGNPNSFPETPALNDIAFGWYLLIVTDATGCSDSQWGYVSPAGDPIEFEVNVEPVTVCYGNVAHASISNLSGGNGEYNYEWRSYSGELIDNSMSSVDLSAGWYVVEVADSDGCIGEQFFEVKENPEIFLEETISHICTNGASGSIKIAAHGGTPPYTYNWSTGSTDPQIDGLSAGDYLLTVTDENGCSLEATYSIISGSQPHVNENITTPTCHNANGIIHIPPLGNLYLPYTYEWSTGGSGSFINNVPMGMYTVTVTNSIGCTEEFTYELVSPDLPVITLESISNTTLTIDPEEGAIDDEVGAIDISASNQFPGDTFSYAWSNGANSEDVHNIPAGEYSVTVTSPSGCTVVENFTIYLCTGVFNVDILNTDIQTISEEGATDGAITPTIYGGTPPYTYSWNSNPPGYFEASTLDIYNLGPGHYVLTVTDACGEEATAEGRILHTCDNFVSIDVNDPCANNPTIYLNQVGNRSSEYYLEWSTGETGMVVHECCLSGSWEPLSGTTEITNLEDNVPYSLTVTDEYGCSAVSDIVFVDPGGNVNTFIDLVPLAPTLAEAYIGVNLDELEVDYGFINYICMVVGYCGNVQVNAGNFAPLEYQPTNTSNPCYGGGVISCTIDGATFTTTVPFGFGQFYVNPVGDCGCLFPTGSTNNNPEYPIFVPCNQLTNNDQDGGTVTPPSLECNGEWEFEYNLSQCRADWYCDGEYQDYDDLHNLCIVSIEPGNIHYNSAATCQYLIYKYCELDPCNSLSLGPLQTCYDISGLCDGNVLNNLLTDYGYAPLNCGNAPTCCADLSALLSPCVPCFTDSGNPNNNFQTREQWMQSFGIVDQPIAVEVFPNPFHNKITANISAIEEGVISIRIIDILGQEVKSVEHGIVAGLNTLEISNLEKLNTGIYHLMVIDRKGNTVIQKIVHQAK